MSFKDAEFFSDKMCKIGVFHEIKNVFIMASSAFCHQCSDVAVKCRGR